MKIKTNYIIKQLVKKKTTRKKKKRNNKKINNIKKYMIKFTFIIYLFFMFTYLKKTKLLNGIIINPEIKSIKNTTIKYSKDYPFERYVRKIITNDKESSSNYFACFVGIGKSENLYARELVEYYISIGFDKFYLGDHNSLDDEPLSNVLKDYIDKGFVDIIDLREQIIQITDYYNYIFNIKKNICKWFSFYDFDEFLVFNDKNMTIKTYLSKEEFNKCDSILTHWLMFYDNDLVHYDNRPVMERFSKPNYDTFENNYHKSIVRSKNYSGILFHNAHQPNISLVKFCDADGNIENFRDGYLGSPKFKYCHLNHYSLKTIEEYMRKFKRGNFGVKYNFDYRLKVFFKYDKITNEKLDIVEKTLNYNCSEFRKYLNSYYPN